MEAFRGRSSPQSQLPGEEIDDLHPLGIDYLDHEEGTNCLPGAARRVSRPERQGLIRSEWKQMESDLRTHYYRSSAGSKKRLAEDVYP
jgi:hypothetical protein